MNLGVAMLSHLHKLDRNRITGLYALRTDNEQKKAQDLNTLKQVQTLIKSMSNGDKLMVGKQMKIGQTRKKE